MKKKIALLLVCAMISAVAGCNNNDRETQSEAEIEQLEHELNKNDTNDTALFDKLVDDGMIIVNVGVVTDCAKTVSGDIVMPDYISDIGDRAFEDCENITGITISGNTKIIGTSAFANCTGLKSVELKEGVEYIGYTAFDDCKNLETLKLPTTVSGIGLGAFEDCIGLKSIDLSNVTGIGECAFAHCTNLSKVILNDNLKSIGHNAFVGCTSLVDVNYKGKTYSYANINDLYDAINNQ